jgi:hemolysin activation/secretion protein
LRGFGVKPGFVVRRHLVERAGGREMSCVALSMGAGDWFRGFDVFERQGSSMWFGSVELRIPVKRDVDFDVMDHMLRLRTVTLAPFYDVGDMYVAGHSLGPVAHALGVGFRFQVDFFSFLERATIRFDVGKAIGLNTAPQFWFGVTQPF